ncbi:MAG TPA: hypothetical protein VJ302_26935, partial [Blastocatellia bacterium]|nr:hypothetical protein [Blastocatellia bacterium]
MTENDYTAFADTLRNEAQFYPGTATLTATKIRGYFDSLGRFELPVIKQILVRLRERSEFFPTIRAIVEQAEGSVIERAEMAWHTFYSLLSEGEYVSLWLYDKAIAYAIESLGGWMKIVDELREASIEMLANFEKRFKGAYKLASDRSSSIDPR